MATMIKGVSGQSLWYHIKWPVRRKKIFWYLNFPHDEFSFRLGPHKRKKTIVYLQRLSRNETPGRQCCLLDRCKSASVEHRPTSDKTSCYVQLHQSPYRPRFRFQIWSPTRTYNHLDCHRLRKSVHLLRLPLPGWLCNWGRLVWINKKLMKKLFINHEYSARAYLCSPRFSQRFVFIDEKCHQSTSEKRKVFFDWCLKTIMGTAQVSENEWRRRRKKGKREKLT